MKLKDLLQHFSFLSLEEGDPETSINYIQSDSRKILDGDVFVLIDSDLEKLKQYTKDAKQKGCKVLLVSEENLAFARETAIPNILRTNQALGDTHGWIASFLKGEPSKKLKVIGITGTNGKTSMTFILYHIARYLRKKAGLIGTIQVKIGERVLETGYTTPEPSSLNLILEEMVLEGIEYVFMEMSSHGLKLGRTAGIHVTGVAFTNITQDHLDFHKTMEDYLDSKLKIFDLLEYSEISNPFGLLYIDAPGGKEAWERLQEKKPKAKILTCGKNSPYDITHPKLSLDSSEFRIHKKSGDSPVLEIWKARTNLLGKFNVSNVGFALCIAHELGFPWKESLSAIEKIPTVPGRFEVISHPEISAIAIVDYAHTPDALENVLVSCKELGPNALVCLFGCGGDRDRTKRPQMAKIASNYADKVIVTSDNPRTEDPEAILAEIEAGFPKGFTSFEKIVSRREAIQKGVELLTPGGILLVAGKGHETVQILGKEKFYFNDKEEVEKALEKSKKGRNL